MSGAQEYLKYVQSLDDYTTMVDNSGGGLAISYKTNSLTSPEKNKLHRGLGLFSLTNIVIANMIGAGIFTTSGLLMGDIGNPWIMLGLWVVGVLLPFAER